MLPAILSGSLLAGCERPVPPPRGTLSPSNYTEQGFRNPHIEARGRRGDFFRWRLGLGPQEQTAIPPEEVPVFQPEVVSPDLPRLQNPPNPGIQVTWIGHSTFLIQVAGINLLTDPVFSERASPVWFAGPRRQVPPGVALEKLPPIHAVIISHNHYDHLDVSMVKRLGNRTKFIIPLGLARWFHNNGITNVEELDWWQSVSLGALRFHSVPAQHFSIRTPFDANQSLWSGWVMDTPLGRVFFAGDTGYSPDFQEIGHRLGPMRLSLLPIGGYMPRWFMRTMHINPVEAVQIHQDLHSVQSIGMHWGTFQLTDEPLNEPPLYLKKVLREARIPEANFIVLKFGETRVFESE